MSAQVSSISASVFKKSYKKSRNMIAPWREITSRSTDRPLFPDFPDELYLCLCFRVDYVFSLSMILMTLIVIALISSLLNLYDNVCLDESSPDPVPF